MADKKDAGSSSRFGFSKMMDGLKDKLENTKLEDAKVHLIHQKLVYVHLVRMSSIEDVERG